jgi:hypothetical protein
LLFKIIINTRKIFFEIYENLVTRPQKFPQPWSRRKTNPVFVSSLRYCGATSCYILKRASTKSRIFDSDVINSDVKMFRKRRSKCWYLLPWKVVFTVTISSCWLSCQLKVKERRYLQNFTLNKEAFSYSETSTTLNH